MAGNATRSPNLSNRWRSQEAPAQRRFGSAPRWAVGGARAARPEPPIATCALVAEAAASTLGEPPPTQGALEARRRAAFLTSFLSFLALHCVTNHLDLLLADPRRARFSAGAADPHCSLCESGKSCPARRPDSCWACPGGSEQSIGLLDGLRGRWSRPGVLRGAAHGRMTELKR